MSSKSSKMMALINYRLRIVLEDGRTLVGQMVAFDKHMNLVMVDCEEFRKRKQKKKSGVASTTTATLQHKVPLEEKRTLGLVILRGENIVSLAVEAGPPPSGDAKSRVSAASLMGQGIGRPAGRGLPMPTPGLPPPGLVGRPTGGHPAPPPGAMMPPGFRPGMPPPPVPGMMPVPGGPMSMMPPPPMPGAGMLHPPPNFPLGFRPMPVPGMPGMPMPPGMPPGMPPRPPGSS